jgi:putative flippase GtrA
MIFTKILKKILNSHLFIFLFVRGIFYFVNLLLFYILVEYLKVNYLVASCLLFVVFTITLYMIDKKLNFKSDKKHKKALGLYFSWYIGSLLINSMLMWLLIECFSIKPVVANAIVIILLAGYNFLGIKFIVFNKGRKKS